MTYPYYAFFDVDGTLIRIKSMLSFQRFYFKRAYPLTGLVRDAIFTAKMAALTARGVDRVVMNARFYESFRGRSVTQVEELADRWWTHLRERKQDLLLRETVSELQKHRVRGAGIVFVSGSFRAILSPLAAELGACAILATDLETRGDRYTGRILPPQTIGAGKARVIGDFLARHKVAAASCWAYGDHSSDAPMLSAVGHSIVIGGDPQVLALARMRNWRVLRPSASWTFVL